MILKGGYPVKFPFRRSAEDAPRARFMLKQAEGVHSGVPFG